SSPTASTASSAGASSAPDERVRRRIVREPELAARRQLRRDTRGQRLAKLDTPLIERVDAPDRALHEDLVLVERDERAQRHRRQLLGQDRVGGPIAFERAMGNLGRRRALRGDLLRRLAEGQRLRLGEEIREQQRVMLADVVERAQEADEIARNQLRALMDELEERVLAVRARLP